ncbi:hypothetical protein [Arcanobacterium buesumense]|uniref:Uncharacterized protein n=1 Tax=Arcanobacterium buesumense TaxID=2722751 RepID=A0A6H2EKG4_9ACTO|nr:hypothetical protein [Arcanobacterium buesumense]QJC21132.1 hypothetical protein HC352_00430 [Arcanobacterium buesumense]
MSDYLAFNDAGIVESDDGTYVLAVMSTAFNDTETLVDLVTVLDKIHQEIVTSLAN